MRQGIFAELRLWQGPPAGRWALEADWTGDEVKPRLGKCLLLLRSLVWPLTAWCALFTSVCVERDVVASPKPAAEALQCPVGALAVGTEAGGLHYCARREPTGRLVPHGPWRSYHANGAPYERGAFVDGRRDGRWQTDDEKGVPIAHGGYTAGLATGPWLLVADQLAVAGQMQAGVRVGPWVGWSAGSLADVALYGEPAKSPLAGHPCRVLEATYDSDGRLHGILRKWEACGSLDRQETFVHGVANGPARYREGGGYAAGTLRAGLWDGVWTLTVDGVKRGEATYRRAVLVGPVTIWRRDGALFAQCQANAGKVADCKWHLPDGVPLANEPGGVERWTPSPDLSRHDW